MIVNREPSSTTAYALGAPISLADLLALPPDGNRYGRDERGRLVLTPPEDAEQHREPIGRLHWKLALALDPAKHSLVEDPEVGFERVFALNGSLLPASYHGTKALEPDMGCLSRPVKFVAEPAGHKRYASSSLLLAVEFLSPSTWRSDLGEGSSPEQVDRWRTYLEAGVPEYWVLNAGFEGCGLPPRSGLFLAFDRARATWSDLPVDGVRLAKDDFRGRWPVLGGRVRSIALPGLVFDLDALWKDCGFSV